MCPHQQNNESLGILTPPCKTFAIYAGAVICFGGLIFAGIWMMSERFQDAIPDLLVPCLALEFSAGMQGWIGYRDQSGDRVGVCIVCRAGPRGTALFFSFVDIKI
jgi:hypothetical protein